MAAIPLTDTETPPGELFRRVLLCLVCLAAVSVAVIFSPAAGLVKSHAGMQSRTASLAP